MLLAASAASQTNRLYLQDRSVIDVLGSGTANARINFERNGVGRSTQGNPSPAWEAREWNGQTIKPTTVGDRYEIRATLVSGSTPSSGPTLGYWHTLDQQRAWANTRSTNGIQESVLDIDIRPKGATNPIVTARMTVRAEIF